MLSKKIKLKVDSSDDDESENLNNFKGIYFNDNQEQKFYEAGAHFQYRELCYRLEKVVMTISPERRGKTMYEDWIDEKEGLYILI